MGFGRKTGFSKRDSAKRDSVKRDSAKRDYSGETGFGETGGHHLDLPGSIQGLPTVGHHGWPSAGVKSKCLNTPSRSSSDDQASS